MSNKKFYIITLIAFIVYEIIYYSYYLFIGIYFRSHPVTQLVSNIAMVIPVILFIVLAVIAFKCGKRNLEMWTKKEKSITLTLIIVPQLLPLLPGLFMMLI